MLNRYYKMKMPYYLSICCVLLLTGCTAFVDPLPPSFTADKKGGHPNKFYVCHGHNCKAEDPATIKKEDWHKIGKLFRYKARTAREERKRIAKAIAKIEKIVGPQTGTEHDRAGTGFPATDMSQLDCISEAVNTTRYLTMIQNEGWLKHHIVSKAERRGYFTDGIWPHNTGTIQEIKSKHIYAVDSWFLANGEEPVILPIKTWKEGWQIPKDKKGEPLRGRGYDYIH